MITEVVFHQTQRNKNEENKEIKSMVELHFQLT